MRIPVNANKTNPEQKFAESRRHHASNFSPKVLILMVNFKAFKGALGQALSLMMGHLCASREELNTSWQKLIAQV